MKIIFTKNCADHWSTRFKKGDIIEIHPNQFDNAKSLFINIKTLHEYRKEKIKKLLNE